MVLKFLRGFTVTGKQLQSDLTFMSVSLYTAKLLNISRSYISSS